MTCITKLYMITCVTATKVPRVLLMFLFSVFKGPGLAAPDVRTRDYLQEVAIDIAKYDYYIYPY